MSNIVKQFIRELSEQDQQAVRSWAEEAIVIRNDEQINHSKKLKQLIYVTSKNEIVIKFLKQLALLLKKHGWDKRNWASRLALSGLLLGLGVGGGKMAGVASAGLGIGVPVYVLTSAGGALIGTILSEITKK